MARPRLCYIKWHGHSRFCHRFPNKRNFMQNRVYFRPRFDLLGSNVTLTYDKQGQATAHFTLKCPKESKSNRVTIVDLFQNDGAICPIAALRNWDSGCMHAPNLPFFRFQDGTPLTGAKMNSILDKTLGLYTTNGLANSPHTHFASASLPS